MEPSAPQELCHDNTDHLADVGIAEALETAVFDIRYYCRVQLFKVKMDVVLQRQACDRPDILIIILLGHMYTK